VSRALPGAVLHSVDAVMEHVLRLVGDGQVRAVDGSLISVDVDSICLHGDTAGSVALAAAVRDALADSGVTIASFV
jgi:UPF0271 protein